MDMLKQAGVSEVPKTWDEYFDTCQKLKDKGIAPNALMTGENSWTTMLMLTFALGSTEEGQKWLMESTPDTADFTDPTVIEAIGKVQKMLGEYATPDAVGASSAVAQTTSLTDRQRLFLMVRG